MNSNTIEASRAETARLLQDWAAYARRWLYRLPGSEGLVCYGTGGHGHWALQAHDTAFSAFAVLAAAPDIDAARVSRDELTATALAMCRYTFQSHHVGGGAAVDGKTWGQSWISALGLERMMHGVQAILSVLTSDDLQRMRCVLLAEADWLLASYPVTAGLTQNNHPESNMWNGTFLHRVARLYPDAPQVSGYLEKGISFLVNAISIPDDAADERLIDGRPLRGWHVGANFTPTYGCNHHGYMNVGYMVITLSNLAMFHFACKEADWTPPESLYLHAREVWQLVKTCTFPDGRLWRIGGDTRVRYGYCQDYAIPVWCFVRDYFGDADAACFETGWVRQVATEAATNGDGSFLGRRLQRLEAASPLYATRLEGDRVCSLGMALAWGPVADAAVAHGGACPPLSAWQDELHGASLVREKKRLASWCWLSGELPQGMCLPPDGSDLAEWNHGLSGRIRGLGIVTDRRIRRNCDTRFDGGFATCGRISVSTDVFISEGDTEDEIACIDLAFAALPDGQTVVGLQHARLHHRTVLRECKGLYLLLPNDCYNRYARRYAMASGERTVTGRPVQGRLLNTGGRWLAVDDQVGILGIYGGQELMLNQPDEAQVTIRVAKYQSHAGDAGGLLYADEVCFGACADNPGMCEAGTLFDVGFAIRASASAAETEVWSRAASVQMEPLDVRPNFRAVRVAGADGCDYLVAANFGETVQDIRFAVDGAVCPETVDGGVPASHQGGALSLKLDPGVARVVRI